MSDFREIKDIWKMSDTYTVVQAAALIAGYDPNSVDANGEHFKDVETGLTRSDGIAEVMAVFTVLVNALNAMPPSIEAYSVFDAEPRYTAGMDILHERGYWGGEVVYEVKGFADKQSYVITKIPNWSKTSIRRDDLCAWLTARGVKSGFFFPDSADEPDYFNQQNNCYAPELAIALQAWQAVSNTNGKGKPKARITEWLNKNTSLPPLSEEAKQRIATVANWEKGGGATRVS